MIPRSANSQMLVTRPWSGTETAKMKRHTAATLTRLPRSLASATGRPIAIWAADAAKNAAANPESLTWNDRCTSGARTPRPLSSIATTNAPSVRSVTGAKPYCRRMPKIGGGLPSPTPGISFRSATASSAPLLATAACKRSSGTANDSSDPCSPAAAGDVDGPPAVMAALTVRMVTGTVKRPKEAAMQVGFIGLGAMGLPMARHLVDAGHHVTVASRSRGPVEEAIRFGAHDGKNPLGVVEASEITILCVPNSPEV